MRLDVANIRLDVANMRLDVANIRLDVAFMIHEIRRGKGSSYLRV